MEQLTDKQLRDLKHMLMEEKNELSAHFAGNDGTGGIINSLSADDAGELSSYDNHPADLGTETFEKSRDMAIDETLSGQLEEVNGALERIDMGRYGSCDVCETSIPYERLLAVPTTTRCIEHAEHTGMTNARPVEEQVMTTPPAGVGAGRQRAAGHFDEADAWSSVQQYGNASDTVNPDAD
ncbi:YteA family regulatory protein [Paenibacillus endophyticus]|uniref:YteA family regulatory protein n=1 Tax=Paenibacillus endophyticus TaxID=1294268 RepID=A0A7W5G970_9BACL|nr:TraR/DksA C4-type zinc finger protein [Paenibacillus endophyticus]MBB3151028.1 YteA family regulatory protein [Paenibacillus endophyticus]